MNSFKALNKLLKSVINLNETQFKKTIKRLKSINRRLESLCSVIELLTRIALITSNM